MGKLGSCLFYDNATMGQYILAIAMLGKGLAFIFFFLAMMLYKAPAKPPVLPVPLSCHSTVSASVSLPVIVRDKQSYESHLSGETATTHLSSRRSSASRGASNTSGQVSPHEHSKKHSRSSSAPMSGVHSKPSTETKYHLLPQ